MLSISLSILFSIFIFFSSAFPLDTFHSAYGTFSFFASKYACLARPIASSNDTCVPKAKNTPILTSIIFSAPCFKRHLLSSPKQFSIFLRAVSIFHFERTTKFFSPYIAILLSSLFEKASSKTPFISEKTFMV